MSGTPNDAAAGDASVGTPDATGSNPLDSTCAVVWGEPQNPQMGAVAGSYNGTSFRAPTSAQLSICSDTGAGESPVFRIYFAFLNVGVHFEVSDTGCTAAASVVADVEDHPLTMTLSGVAHKPDVEVNVVDPPTFSFGYAAGHVHLSGRTADGPLEIDADFSAAESVADSCHPSLPAR
jgi:hypothetical protein